ncbi:MAG: Flp pilus assembly complex ATPase component TadA [Kiritimatiellales bacterium]|nr:Flp pilus assembly complex ATPase component TadA [Pontiella sp.]NNJ70942.1 Flp pilus assembly complex ATPase component TadA [Kiritimatiellales bacterium]
MITDQLSEMMIRSGRVGSSELEKAMAIQEKTGQVLTDILIEEKLTSSEDIARTYSELLNIPYLELNEEFHLQRDEYDMVPESVARRFCLFPLVKEEGVSLTLVMKNPLDMDAVDTVRSLTSLEIHKAVSTEEKIRTIIEKCYKEEAYVEAGLRDIVDIEAAAESAEFEGNLGDVDQLLVHANDAPVVRYVNLLLMEAVRDGASDIHFEPGENSCSVRLRVDGSLHPVTPPPKSLYAAIITRIKILSEMDIAERRLPLDGRFKFKFSGRVVDVRVSSMPLVFGEKVVMRILDKQSLVVDLEDIGFEGDTLKRFKEILNMPNGIVLLTGPTGSGKTTTLYSALGILRSPTKNVQTVEDPVEYLVEGINQMPTRPRIGLNFAECLRHILRQDPDAVMIGEIRDAETAEIAMRASLTGHIVLSTLHTNDSTSSFSRLRDIGIPSYMTAATMRLIIAQRLVKTICPNCKEPYQPDAGELEWVKPICADAESWTYYHGAGCNQCRDSGMKGRRAIFEFLEVTPPLRELVHTDADDLTLRKKAIEGGMETLAQNGLSRVRNGETTVSEAIQVCLVD